MSKVPRQTDPMRIDQSIRFGFRSVPGKTIAKFGPVMLVQYPDGRYALIGGQANERAMVRDWCRQYATFVVFEPPIDRIQVISLAA